MDPIGKRQNSRQKTIDDLNATSDPLLVHRKIAQAKKAKGETFIFGIFCSLKSQAKSVFLQSLTEVEIRSNLGKIPEILSQETATVREEFLRVLLRYSISGISKLLAEYYWECSIATKIMILRKLAHSSSHETEKVLKEIQERESQPELQKLLIKALQRRSERGKTKTLLLCALPEEGDALRRKLDKAAYFVTKTTKKGVLVSVDRESRLITNLFKTIGDSGNALSKEASEELVSIHNPDQLILFGITAGIRGRVRQGDLMITDRVWDLRKCKIGDKFSFRPALLESPKPIALPVRKDTLEVQLRSQCGKNLRIHTDLLCGSSDNLLRKRTYMRAAAMTHDKLGGMEMEAAGIAETSIQHNIPFLIIKSIHDYGDEEKDDSYRAVCCQMVGAAVFQLFFLRSLSDLETV